MEEFNGNTVDRKILNGLGNPDENIMDKDGIIMRGIMENLDWLARQISIFSFDFVVREPAQLRKHSAKLADLAEIHSRKNVGIFVLSVTNVTLPCGRNPDN